MICTSAIFSNCRRFRFLLSRKWNNKPNLLFIGHNPSTADEINNDQTTKKIIGYAKIWGYGGINIVNLNPYVARNKKVADSIKCNIFIYLFTIFYIIYMSLLHKKIIYAWGSTKKEPIWLKLIILNPLCIRILKNGNPAHPCRAKYTSFPIRYIR